MKLLSKFTIIFMGVFISVFTPLFVFTRIDAEASAMNTRVNDSMITAAFDAMQTMRIKNGYAFKLESQQREALDTFYRSLAMGYFKANTGENDPLLESFIPFVMLVDSDGIYICYNREYYNWGTTDLPYYITPQYRFTENYFDGATQYTIDYELGDALTVYKDGRKIADGSYIKVKKILDASYPSIYHACEFLLSDTAYKEERQMVVTSLAQRLVNRYLNWDVYGDSHESGYNTHGREHTFIIPVKENDNWQRALMSPTIMAFYEGIQTDILNGYVAQVAFSGGELTKADRYYVNVENIGGSWTRVYHLPTCSHINPARLDTDYSSFPSMEDAAKSGAYPCHDCIK